MTRIDLIGLRYVIVMAIACSLSFIVKAENNKQDMKKSICSGQIQGNYSNITINCGTYTKENIEIEKKINVILNQNFKPKIGVYREEIPKFILKEDKLVMAYTRWGRDLVKVGKTYVRDRNSTPTCTSQVHEVSIEDLDFKKMAIGKNKHNNRLNYSVFIPCYGMTSCKNKRGRDLMSCYDKIGCVSISSNNDEPKCSYSPTRNSRHTFPSFSIGLNSENHANKLLILFKKFDFVK